MHVAAIIAAAGQGTRLGGAAPKQLLPLGGRSILQRSVDAFDRCDRVAELVVVLPPDLAGDVTAAPVTASKALARVAGAARRQDSVARGFEVVAGRADVVVVHDAARPFVTADLIVRTIEAAAESGAAIAALGVRDTVKRAAADRRFIGETLPRGELFLAQTPQAFRADVLRAAIEAGRAGGDVTDEAMLIERAGHAVRLVDGDPHNIKITTADDLVLARALVGEPPRAMTRIGTGYDLHRLAEGRRLVLAGVELPFDRGPVGHSDGDVVCHAVVDAILGAAAAGDIGAHFPDTDPRWKDAPGLDLLARAVAVIAERGYRVANVDVVVVLERPTIGPHAAQIRRRVAEALGIDAGAVSVKGKTNEGVDAVGRGEAIAAHAVALLCENL